MGILSQLIKRFDPPNLKFKATVLFMFYGFLFFFQFFFVFFLFFFVFYPFFVPLVNPLTRLARPCSESVSGSFLQFS